MGQIRIKLGFTRQRKRINLAYTRFEEIDFAQREGKRTKWNGRASLVDILAAGAEPTKTSRRMSRPRSNLSGSINICRPKMNQHSGLTAGLPLLPCPLKTLLFPSFHGDLAPDFPCLSTAPKNPKVNHSMLVASHLSCSEVTQASLHQYCCSSDQNNRCVVSLFHY